MFTCTVMSLYHDVICQSVNLPVVQGRPSAKARLVHVQLLICNVQHGLTVNPLMCCRQAANCGFADFMKKWQGQHRDAGSL